MWRDRDAVDGVPVDCYGEEEHEDVQDAEVEYVAVLVLGGDGQGTSGIDEPEGNVDQERSKLPKCQDILEGVHALASREPYGQSRYDVKEYSSE